jgi:ABC-type lipoprotein release transport system permease subunit
MHNTIGGDDGTDVEALLARVEAHPEVESATPRLFGGGLLSSGEQTVAALLLGVDPERELRVSTLLTTLTDGRLPQEGDFEVLVGAEMAQQLEAGVGDEIVIVAPASDGSMGNDLYTIAGIFHTGTPGIDANYAILPVADLQYLLAMEPGRIHEIVATVTRSRETPAIAASLAASLIDGAPPLDVKPWTELRPELAEAVALMDSMSFVIVIIIFAMAVFGVANTMLIGTFERRREFAVIRALGTSSGSVSRTVVYEGMILGVISLALGGLVTWPVMVWWHNTPPDLSTWFQGFEWTGVQWRPILRVEYSADPLCHCHRRRRVPRMARDPGPPRRRPGRSMRLLVLFGLAARGLGRNARRSLLTAAAMVLGLALLIFSRALSDGGHEQWIESAVRMGTGHVAVQAPRYLETGKLEYRLDEERLARTASAIAALPPERGVQAWSVRMSVDGLASSASSALPVRVEGVDPEREAAFSQIADKIQDGRYLEPDDRLHAFVGVELARRLDLEIGNRFVLTAQTASGEVEGQLVRVTGIFRTAVQELDEGLIHVPIETVRDWLGTPAAATTVAILLDNSLETPRTAAALADELADDAGIRVMGWREAAPDLDSAVRIDDYGDYVFHIILFAIIALAILNAVLISVLGRRREFGILQAMGLTGFETGFVVFVEGVLLTAASGAIGVVVGYLFTWVLFRDGLDFSAFMSSDMSFSGSVIDPVIVPFFQPRQVIVSLYFILVIGTLASLYPAVRASRLDPADAMKFEQ